MPIAFKEWAVTVRALAEGEQLLTLRKGGIREENKHFELEHERFFLYPTFDHQQNDLVRPSHHPELDRALEEGVWPDEEPPARALLQDGGIAQPDRVRIRAWAEVAEHITIDNPKVVDGLSPFYIWTTDYASKRLNWKPRHPLHLVLLRVHRIPRPVTVRVREEYHGCRSWVEIDRDLPFEGTPVMADEEFERASAEIRAVCTGEARSRASRRVTQSPRTHCFTKRASARGPVCLQEHRGTAICRTCRPVGIRRGITFMRRIGIAAVAAFVLLFAGTTVQASAAPTPEPYQSGDATGFNAILPPGTNGFASLADLVTVQGGGPLPTHSDDQLAPYTDLIFDYPSLNEGNLDDYFHDGSFGVKPANVDRTYSPRDDVTIVRDELGTPHVYGSTRAGTMFGAGYSGAEDRLFFMDALRHAGRGQLSSFAGGANVGMDIDVWKNSPYKESDLEKQFNYSPPGLKADFDAVRDGRHRLRRRHQQVHRREPAQPGQDPR